MTQAYPPYRALIAMEMGEFLQTDAAINKGNSGGPMFNMNGDVVGIVSHILSKSGGYEGVGFALTSNTAKQLMLENPSFWNGMLGFPLPEGLAKILNVPQKTGMLVQKVAAYPPASRLGLKGGTNKLEIDRKNIAGRRYCSGS